MNSQSHRRSHWHPEPEIRDTGLAEAPPCPIMEIEPNDNYDEAQVVFLEKWICGDYDKEFDLDNYISSSLKMKAG